MIAAYQQRVNMAKLPEGIWAKAVRETENINLSEFFGPLMRLDDEEKISICLDTHVERGKIEPSKQV